MVTRNELLKYLNELLTPALFNDYAPNGLQVEGKDNITTLVTGVTACQDLLVAAEQEHADAILVHHGYFWKEEDRTIVGIRKVRLNFLLKHNINLFAYHLPLDAHSEYGNNAQLAKLLKINVISTLSANNNQIAIGNIGVFTNPYNVDSLVNSLTQILQRKPLHIPGKAKAITKVAWCTGGGQWRIDAAVAAGVDAYITGEISEATVHIARETGIHLFAAGHHATEKFGVQAVGEAVAQKFGVMHKFIDIDNPV
jgi:dinuclear metal center YbgI/SA1388 family protein